MLNEIVLPDRLLKNRLSYLWLLQWSCFLTARFGTWSSAIDAIFTLILNVIIASWARSTWSPAVYRSLILILNSVITSWACFTWSSTVNFILVLIMNSIIAACARSTGSSTVDASFTLILDSINASRNYRKMQNNPWKRISLRPLSAEKLTQIILENALRYFTFAFAIVFYF